MTARTPILDSQDLVPEALLPRRTAGAPLGRGIVCFTWDDGYGDSWAPGLDKADALGQKHTLAVTTNRIGVTASPQGVTNSQILDWYNRGHEIASHACTHPSMSGLTSTTRTPEWDDSRSILEDLVGVGNVTTFVYPFGNRSTTTDQEAFGRYSRVADYQIAAVVPMEDRMGTFHTPRVQATLPSAGDLIRLAARQPVIVVLAFHNPGGFLFDGVTADPLTLQNAYDLMQQAHDAGIPCLTLAEAFPGQSMLMDASFERGQVATWRVSGVGTSVATATPDAGIAGTQVFQITTADTFGAGGRQVIPVTPGRSYTLSGRAKLVSGTLSAGYIRAQLVSPADYAGPALASNLDTAGTVVAQASDITSTSWTRFSVSYTVPVGTRFIEVQLVARNQAGITAYFDHVDFRPTSQGSFG